MGYPGEMMKISVIPVLSQAIVCYAWYETYKAQLWFSEDDQRAISHLQWHQ